MKNHYQSLGLKSDATLNEIKISYRKLALKFHPDQNEGDSFFEDRFKDLQEAYEVLSDIEKRKMYDKDFDSFFGNQTLNNSNENSNKYPNDLDSKTKNNVIDNDKNNGATAVLFAIGMIIMAIFLYLNNNKNKERTNDIQESNQTNSSSILIEPAKDSIDSKVVPETEIINNTPVIVEETKIVYSNNDALKYLKEDYDFYRRDYVFRNPKFKKISDSAFEVSIEECINKEPFMEGDFHWHAKILILEIYSDGKYTISERQ